MAVTLYVRVWIETKAGLTLKQNCLSHPLREGVDWNRWLRYYHQAKYTSPSTWGCGLKLAIYNTIRSTARSPSTWGCGLKPVGVQSGLPKSASPSTWGCGLKLLRACIALPYLCHPLREGVDWNWINLSSLYWRVGHPLREGVDWNQSLIEDIVEDGKVTLYVRVWIETCRNNNRGQENESPSTWGCGLKRWLHQEQRRSVPCHPLREGVDWNVIV